LAHKYPGKTSATIHHLHAQGRITANNIKYSDIEIRYLDYD